MLMLRSFFTAAMLVAVLCLALTSQVFATNFFVNKSSPPPSGDGESWAEAFLTLQEALAEAALTQGPHTIRIAAGIYYVDEGLSGAADEEDSFFVPSGTTILAGYPTSGTPGDGERNPRRYLVRLSGDIDRASQPDGTYSEFVARNYGKVEHNVHHVIVVDDSADDETRISGVIVEGGNADGEYAEGNGGGIYCGDGTPRIHDCVIQFCRAKVTNAPAGLFEAFDGLGGGLYASGAHDGALLEIRDTRFQHCHALWGGGLYKKPTVDPAPTNSILLDGCVFLSNRADRVTGATARGGGAALDHGIGKIDVVNCEFTLNSCETDPGDGSTGAGGGIHVGLPTQYADCLSGGCTSGCGSGFDDCTEDCVGPGSGMTCPDMSCEECKSNAAFTNCVFRANLGSAGGGGAVRLRRKATFNQCTFVANTTDYSAGGAVVAIGHEAIAEFNSCILWGNTATALDPEEPGLESQIQLSGSACFSLHNCDVQWLSDPGPTSCHLSFSSSTNIEEDPMFVLDPDPGTQGWGAGQDDVLGDLRLKPGSPCIDAGADAKLPTDVADIDDSLTIDEDLPLDLDYRTRSIDGDCGSSSPVVDVGAYEYWCVGDLNGDCTVNGTDSAILLAAWEENVNGYFPCPQYITEDLSRDCKVNGRDLAMLLDAWGPCPDGESFMEGGSEQEDELFEMLYAWYLEENWDALLEWALSQLP